MAADSVGSVVASVVDGRFREQLWTSRRTGQVVAAVGWIRAHDSAAWQAIGDRSRPPPILRALRYEHRRRDDAPYDPPLWDRLLHALHERGGTCFDPDEAERARQWVATSKGGRLTREYLDVDPASRRERRLRAMIEAQIRT